MTDEIGTVQRLRSVVWAVLRAEASGHGGIDRASDGDDGDRYIEHLVARTACHEAGCVCLDGRLSLALGELRVRLDLYSRYGQAAMSPGAVALVYREVCQLLDRRYRERTHLSPVTAPFP
ncbi:MAG: hypothetical protein ACLQVK_13120 [Acidimicrobiales bacterium]